MKPILVLRDEDIFPRDFKHEENWNAQTERVAVRVIAFDQGGKIALCGTRYQLLPGGGVEKGEALEDAVRREIWEEIGCKIGEIKQITVAEEFRDHGKRHQINHCFVGKIIGEKGEPQPIDLDEQGMEVYWYGFDEAIEILEEQVTSIPFLSYNSCFNVRTHLTFLKYFKENKIQI